MANIEYNNTNFSFSFTSVGNEEKDIQIPSGQSGTLNELFDKSYLMKNL